MCAIPQLSAGDFQYSVQDEKSAVQEGNCNGDCTDCPANVEVIIGVIDGQCCAEQEEDDEAFCHVDVVFAIWFDDAQNRETQRNQQTVNELQEREGEREEIKVKKQGRENAGGREGDSWDQERVQLAG